MYYRELKKTSGPKHAMNFSQCTLMIRHIHKTHQGRGEVESAGGERQFQCARHGISDVEGLVRFCLSGVAYKRRRDIDTGRLRAVFGELPGIVPFSTTHVQSLFASNIGQ